MLKVRNLFVTGRFMFFHPVGSIRSVLPMSESEPLIRQYSVFHSFQSLVQIETLGEFGVFFILFSVGLEFSPDKIKKV